MVTDPRGPHPGRGGTRGAAAPAPTRAQKAAGGHRACALRPSRRSRGEDGGVLGYVAGALGPQGSSRPSGILSPLPAGSRTPCASGAAPPGQLLRPPSQPARGSVWLTVCQAGGCEACGGCRCLSPRPRGCAGCEKWLSEWFCRFYCVCGSRKGAA